MTVSDLVTFHRPVILWAAQSGADLLALETIPDVNEICALIQLMGDVAMPTWLSLSIQDGKHLADGTPLELVASLCKEAGFWAVGVNCCSPVLATSALEVLGNAGLPLIVYPNSGEMYEEGEWQGDCQALAPFVERWIGLGVAALGGCCRTTPKEIGAMRKILDGES